MWLPSAAVGVFYVLVWKQDVYLWQICRVYVSHVQYRMCWHFVKVKLRTVKVQIVNVFFMLNNMLYCLFWKLIILCCFVQFSTHHWWHLCPLNARRNQECHVSVIQLGGSYSENSWGEETRRCACCPLSSKEIWRFITL